jgi:uncharacterized protein (DUF1684 family)
MGKIKRVILVCRGAGAIVLAMVVIGAAGCRPASPDGLDYAGKVAASRAAKDTRFKTANSPLPESRKAVFLPLAYYPVDPEYDVPGVLKASLERPVLTMPTSTGGQRPMRRVGSVEFTLQGEPMKLTAFIEAGATDLDRLFVPFTDATSGAETYPAGRYLDLDRAETGEYHVDFNYAYHPFCYFNETLECPLPPAENRLSVSIYAGEKLKP